MVNRGEVDDVEEFPYLGATVDKEGSNDIVNRLQKARNAFQRLGKVWAIGLIYTNLRPTFTVVSCKLIGAVTCVVIRQTEACSIILARRIEAIIHH